MSKRKPKQKSQRRQHAPEFRVQALALADKIGVAAAARELDLHESQIYGWRSKAKAERSTSDLEKQQAVEIAKLKRQLADQDEELAIVKKLLWIPRVAATHSLKRSLRRPVFRTLLFWQPAKGAWRTRVSGLQLELSGSEHAKSPDSSGPTSGMLW